MLQLVSHQKNHYGLDHVQISKWKLGINEQFITFRKKNKDNNSAYNPDFPGGSTEDFISRTCILYENFIHEYC